MAPAERTGATALRPSFGCIGRSGVMSLVDSLVSYCASRTADAHDFFHQWRVQARQQRFLSDTHGDIAASWVVCLAFWERLAGGRMRRIRWAPSAGRRATARPLWMCCADATRTTRAPGTCRSATPLR